jgi:hypothetical protein
MMKPRVLVCDGRWLDWSRVGVDSPSKHCFVDSLISLGIFDVRMCYLDLVRLFGGSVNVAFVTQVREWLPDVVVNFPIRSHPEWCVDRELLRVVQRRGCRVVTVLPDIWSDVDARWVLDHYGESDLVVLTDNDPALVPGLVGRVNVFGGWACLEPWDCRCVGRERRPFDVGFVGEFREGSSRAGCLRRLVGEGFRCFLMPGQRVDGLSFSDVRRVLQGSKVGPVFSRCSEFPPRWHIKSRLFEVAQSGAVIVDERGSQTGRFFRDGVEWFSFGSADELVEVVWRVCSDGALRARVGRAAYERAQLDWGPWVFWPRVLGLVGVKCGA